MGKKLCCLILLAALLAGCTARGEVLSPPEQPQLPEQSAAHFTPEPDMPQAPILEDNPDSPYPMAVESWQVDMDGDSIDELVELRAEKGYFGNEIEPETWFEGDGMHPYTLVVTQGKRVWELPLGREDNREPPLLPIYWDQERTGRRWDQDQSGRPILVLWFDGLSRVLDIYAVAWQDGGPALLSIPEDSAAAVLDQRYDWD